MSDFELEIRRREPGQQHPGWKRSRRRRHQRMRSGAGGAAVVAGDGTPWSSLCLCSGLWSTPFLHSFSYDDHGLIWPLAPAR